MMAAYSREGLAIRAFRSGVTDYLKKPFTFAYLIGKLSELLERKKNRDLPEGGGSREVFIMDCIAAIIDKNYERDLTRDELAKLACMDKYKFSKIFNGRFGQTLPSYINRVRVRRAAALLLGNTGLTITEAAHSVGYRNVNHFIRAFKSAFGAPPLQYRKNEKQEEPVSVPTEWHKPK
jgi:AraC-like DNA-binding protein